MTPRVHTVVDSPVGPLTVVAENDALVGLYMRDQRYRPADETIGTAQDPAAGVLARAAEQLTEFFAGRRTTFDLPIAPVGTDFQRTVWAALREIPYGTVTTYAEIARRIGRPTASRAVGLANGRNPISVVVPCHRVVGGNGSLTGYAGGLDRKRALLALEAAGLAALPAAGAPAQMTLPAAR
jgi:methylated-DNA-[protein]-cysteine S-methyltransferase